MPEDSMNDSVIPPLPRLTGMNIGLTFVDALPTECDPRVLCEIVSIMQPELEATLIGIEKHLSTIRKIKATMFGLERYYFRTPNKTLPVDFMNLGYVVGPANNYLTAAHDTYMAYRSLILRRLGKLDDEQDKLRKIKSG